MIDLALHLGDSFRMKTKQAKDFLVQQTAEQAARESVASGGLPVENDITVVLLFWLKLASALVRSSAANYPTSSIEASMFCRTVLPARGGTHRSNCGLTERILLCSAAQEGQ
jgi:hypothetical protein